MNKQYKIAIVGLGYVGLPLAVAFSEHFTVIGFDINLDRIKALNNSVDSNGDIQFLNNNNILFTNNLHEITDANIYIITVPTPVKSDNTPDLSKLESASTMVANFLAQDDIVIYESTVYPGVTEDICVPILERKSNLKYNVDFYCGYSPERISPGADKYRLENVMKITSGSNEKIAEIVDALYNKIIKAGTYRAPSIKVAEASKVVENTQRDVNIALMNELAMMFDKMEIDTLEVLDAAKTKWNFLDFKPGLVGGHCIGVDPYYLLHKSEKSGYKPNLLHSSRKINNSIAGFIVDKTIKLMVESDKTIKNSNILILGYTFKENCSDTRNTKVKDIVEGLSSFSCKVEIFDPYIAPSDNNNFISLPFEGHAKYDAIILAVTHNEFLKYSMDDFYKISNGKLVFLDIKGVYKESTWKL
jgi:UDP-N-acetyl-D-galactosamine dehydrogenase